MKDQLIKSIEEFKGKWHILGFKGWLAETLLDIVNLIGITEQEKKDIANEAEKLIPKVKFPTKYFSESVDKEGNRVITVSEEFEKRLLALEKFEKDLKNSL